MHTDGLEGGLHTFQNCALDGGEMQSRSGRGGEEKSPSSATGFNPGRPARSQSYY